MIGPCVCTTTYFCVSCRVKRGDYSDWLTAKPAPRVNCISAGCDRLAVYRSRHGMCWKHYNNQQWRKKHAIPNKPYVKLADR